ncbi:MAG: hypothetical protein AB7T37_18730, partial [Dehalococcoidia bacterium]
MKVTESDVFVPSSKMTVAPTVYVPGPGKVMLVEPPRLGLGTPALEFQSITMNVGGLTVAPNERVSPVPNGPETLIEGPSGVLVAVGVGVSVGVAVSVGVGVAGTGVGGIGVGFPALGVDVGR